MPSARHRADACGPETLGMFTIGVRQRSKPSTMANLCSRQIRLDSVRDMITNLVLVAMR